MIKRREKAAPIYLHFVRKSLIISGAGEWNRTLVSIPRASTGSSAWFAASQIFTVTAGLQAYREGADDVAWEWSIQRRKIIAFAIHGALRKGIPADNPLGLMLGQCG